MGGFGMEAFAAAFLVVFLAEMGDKTQLLAIALGARYSWKPVLGGILAATVANHLLAVAAGVYLGSLVDEDLMHKAASVAFIVFGLWTIRGDELEEESPSKGRSPFWTVAIAFFLAEMADKTQFATITLAAKYQSLFPVLAGTTTGMMVADGIGVLLGSAIHRVIPEKFMRYFAAAVFLGIGIAGLAF